MDRDLLLPIFPPPYHRGRSCRQRGKPPRRSARASDRFRTSIGTTIMLGRLSSELLLRNSRFPEDPRTIAYAGTISRAIETNRNPLIRGLPEDDFQRLLRTCFPGITLQNGVPLQPAGTDEFDDLLSLLRVHAVTPDEAGDWLAHCIASAAMAPEHLWQEMGLPNRATLSNLFSMYFPGLAADNTRNMKWKKYLYRKLCEREEITVCRAPHCDDCSDYAVCFGPESAHSAANSH